jgi:hypothetical protein
VGRARGEGACRGGGRDVAAIVSARTGLQMSETLQQACLCECVLGCFLAWFVLFLEWRACTCAQTYTHTQPHTPVYR